MGGCCDALKNCFPKDETIQITVFQDNHQAWKRKPFFFYSLLNVHGGVASNLIKSL